jgi:hypothetical protein
MTSRVAPKHCALREALGEHELCPGPECSFWEEDGGCTVERLELVDLGHQELLRHLLALRLRLDEARAEGERQEGPSRLRKLLNQDPE